MQDIIVYIVGAALVVYVVYRLYRLITCRRDSRFCEGCSCDCPHSGNGRRLRRDKNKK